MEQQMCFFQAFASFAFFLCVEPDMISQQLRTRGASPLLRRNRIDTDWQVLYNPEELMILCALTTDLRAPETISSSQGRA
jgi:hypothetical protein